MSKRVTRLFFYCHPWVAINILSVGSLSTGNTATVDIYLSFQIDWYTPLNIFGVIKCTVLFNHNSAPFFLHTQKLLRLKRVVEHQYSLKCDSWLIERVNMLNTDSDRACSQELSCISGHRSHLATAFLRLARVKTPSKWPRFSLSELTYTEVLRDFSSSKLNIFFDFFAKNHT